MATLSDSVIPWRAMTDETVTQDLRRMRRKDGTQRGITVLWTGDPAGAAGPAISVPLVGDLSIGRALRDDVSLTIDDASLSRKHVTIRGSTAGVEIEDHDSKNGTFVNGVRVSRAHLEEGSVVRIGDTLLELGRIPRNAPSPAEDGQ